MDAIGPVVLASAADGSGDVDVAPLLFVELERPVTDRGDPDVPEGVMPPKGVVPPEPTLVPPGATVRLVDPAPATVVAVVDPVADVVAVVADVPAVVVAVVDGTVVVVVWDWVCPGTAANSCWVGATYPGTA